MCMIDDAWSSYGDLDAVWGGRMKDPPLRPGSDEPPKTSSYLRRACADLRSLRSERIYRWYVNEAQRPMI